jgi:hypothetical protein
MEAFGLSNTWTLAKSGGAACEENAKEVAAIIAKRPARIWEGEDFIMRELGAVLILAIRISASGAKKYSALRGRRPLTHPKEKFCTGNTNCDEMAEFAGVAGT